MIFTICSGLVVNLLIRNQRILGFDDGGEGGETVEDGGGGD